MRSFIFLLKIIMRVRRRLQCFGISKNVLVFYDFHYQSLSSNCPFPTNNKHPRGPYYTIAVVLVILYFVETFYNEIVICLSWQDILSITFLILKRIIPILRIYKTVHTI